MKRIPPAVIPRLSLYYRSVLESRKDFLSSEEISKLTYFSASQVRKDLAYFGQFGIPSKGYNTKKLKRAIEKILGLDKKWEVALIGVGNLGSALLSYKGFTKQGFYIHYAFDKDRRKIGKKVGSVLIRDIVQLEKVIRSKKVSLAILAVPKEEAQIIVDRLINCGIKAILNFAPIRPYVPKGVVVLNIDLSIELERLAYFLKQSLK
jgi:redox-sensing transcriptional repressor